MNFENARFNMVEQQLRPWDILDPKVLSQLMAIKREDFVPAPYRALALADTQIPLGYGAAMLAPKFEAQTLQALHLRATDRVLEIGSGSGFMAALLARFVHQVWSVECVPELAVMARRNLQLAGVNNVSVLEGDGMTGLPAHAPFDAIVLSGSVPEIPPALVEQLAPGGRLFAIVGAAPAMQARCLTKTADHGLTTRTLFETSVGRLHGPATSTFVF